MGNTCQSQVLLCWVLVYSALSVCVCVWFPSGDLTPSESKVAIVLDLVAIILDQKQIYTLLFNFVVGKIIKSY